MSYYINLFLTTELTSIPRIVDKYIGKYYNNAVGNALTWVFAMWLVLHYLYDSYQNILLKQMHMKLYVRTRLSNALWYCGFFSTGFLYCLGTIVYNNTSVMDYRRKLTMDCGPVPLHLLMGMGLIGTFFFQSITWNSIKYGFDKNCLTFLTLTLLPVTAYYSRRTELFISLVAVVSIVHLNFNCLRALSSAVGKNGHVYMTGLFFASLGIFILFHVIVIPIFFIVPLVYNLRHGLDVPVLFLSINLVLWWVAEAFSNPLYKYLEHWIKHAETTNPRQCPGNMVECCLFEIRDDLAFNMWLVKREIKQRKEKSIMRRKPKDRGVFVRTLKCMVAIRRKLNNKKRDNSESDSESDKEKPADDGNEADSSGSDEEEEWSDEGEEEEDDEKDPMKREYQEETARALLEDLQKHQNEPQESENIDKPAETIEVPLKPNTEPSKVDDAEETNKKND